MAADRAPRIVSRSLRHSRCSLGLEEQQWWQPGSAGICVDPFFLSVCEQRKALSRNSGLVPACGLLRRCLFDLKIFRRGDSQKRLDESKVNLAVERIQFVVNTLRRRLRLKYFVLRADRVLRLFNRLERSRGKKRKDRRPETDDASRGNENGPP